MREQKGVGLGIKGLEGLGLRFGSVELEIFFA
jgi:hypothetical protein